MSAAFGKFPSLSAFLESYKAQERKKLMKPLVAGKPSVSLKKIKAQQKKKERDVVEVEAVLNVREPDDTDPAGGQHVRLRVSITVIDVNDPDVAKDVKNAKDTGRDVFVAIRVGDSMGIQEKITGLAAGAALHMRGEWITKEKAQSHGGEKMSVLHFTHHPVGFICTPVKCFA